MSRSGYVYDDDPGTELYRANVDRALHGKRGQAFLKEMLAALDALPEKKLIVGYLETSDGSVCAIGAVGRARGIAMGSLDVEDTNLIAAKFGIADAMVREIFCQNDEPAEYWIEDETPNQRFYRMRRWIKSEIE